MLLLSQFLLLHVFPSSSSCSSSKCVTNITTTVVLLSPFTPISYIPSLSPISMNPLVRSTHPKENRYAQAQFGANAEVDAKLASLRIRVKEEVKVQVRFY